MLPEAGSDDFVRLSLCQPRWNFTFDPTFTQSISASTGRTTAQSQAVEQMSTVLAPSSQTNVKPKQQLVPVGTPLVETQIQPVQPTGTGFGAGVKSSLTSAAENPGQTPCTVHGIGFGQL